MGCQLWCLSHRRFFVAFVPHSMDQPSKVRTWNAGNISGDIWMFLFVRLNLLFYLLTHKSLVGEVDTSEKRTNCLCVHCFCPCQPRIFFNTAQVAGQALVNCSRSNADDPQASSGFPGIAVGQKGGNPTKAVATATGFSKQSRYSAVFQAE